jgi:hypothetical protein
MGTMSSDAIGLCHAAPPTIPVKQSLWVDARWEEWIPWCTQLARRMKVDPAAALVPLRVIHRSRVVMLLSARVTWASIKRNRLDNPLDSNDVFEFQLRAAIERRRTRMGRVKGMRRTHV